MKRALVVLALAGAAATPVAAQLVGMPVWNSPKGGTGITINGDFGKPSTDAGGGSAFGARGSLGLGNIEVGVGLSSWKPSGASSSATSFGGDLAFRVIGGTLLPVSINLQGGAASTSSATSGGPKLLTATGAVGVSVSVPTPGISIEPYVSPGIRYYKLSGGTGSSNFGFAIGANVGFGMFGVHVAYDYTKGKNGAPNASIIGVGVHIGLKSPIGMPVAP
ncbi:MAG TPA: hypothetical protein VFK78_07785 [Gemmatimonadales bacterium]|nr:hypothetical protein [Gemmatimonadales bacterium]